MKLDAPLPFVKSHGLGNDFVIVDAAVAPDDLPAFARCVADRHYGVGCDQLLVCAPPSQADADIRMEIYNGDGSRAEMCGNGIRAFARYVWDSGRLPRGPLRVQTLAGVRVCMPAEAADRVRVDMGVPAFGLADVGANMAHAPDDWCEPLHNLVRGDWPMAGIDAAHAVSMGNPHLVLFLPPDADLDGLTIESIGPLIEHDPLFPARINVEFVVAAGDDLYTRVWERGAGATRACGTGACAVAAAAIATGRAASPVTVHLPGGPLQIDWDGRQVLWMTGDAVLVFSGTLEPEACSAWQERPDAT